MPVSGRAVERVQPQPCVTLGQTLTLSEPGFLLCETGTIVQDRSPVSAHLGTKVAPTAGLSGSGTCGCPGRAVWGGDTGTQEVTVRFSPLYADDTTRQLNGPVAEGQQIREVDVVPW